MRFALLFCALWAQTLLDKYTMKGDAKAKKYEEADRYKEEQTESIS